MLDEDKRRGGGAGTARGRRVAATDQVDDVQLVLQHEAAPRPLQLAEHRQALVGRQRRAEDGGAELRRLVQLPPITAVCTSRSIHAHTTHHVIT